MLPALLSLARKVVRSRNADAASKPTHSSSRRFGWARILTILSVLVMGVAFLLSMLCIFAGSKPGMMEPYAVFTLNTSRIGENLKQELDNRINSVHFKRSEPVLVELPTITATPTTLVTVLPRVNIGNDFSSLTHQAHSELHHASSKLHSAATSVESAAASQASGALNSIKSDVVKAVNSAFEGIISDLHLKDFYSVHLMATCSGEYVTGDGKNITTGSGPLPVNGVHEHVDTCEPHSAIDPMSLIRVIYWIGAACTGIALVLAFVGVFLSSRKIALANVAATFLAFCFIGLASAVTHGVAVGAAKFIDFVGGDIGVAGYVGRKFLTLTWAATVLLLLNATIWSVLIFKRGREAGKAAGHGMRGGRDDQIPLTSISRPMPVAGHGGRYEYI